MTKFVEICEKAARAGAVELKSWRGRFLAKEKAPKDLVTEADLASQRAIADVVLGAFPDHRFLGEEDEGALDEQDWSGYLWVVDPLDGTANYVHGLPAYAVSVALTKEGEPIAGAVLDPTLDECYLAELGSGATLNGGALKSSDCHKLEHAMLAASFSAQVPRGSKEIERFVELLPQTRAIRRLGSAALNLCYVAAGRLDGYWASSVKAWDVAAGALILQEAGGVITNLEGGLFEVARPQLVAAGNDELARHLVEALTRAVAER